MPNYEKYIIKGFDKLTPDLLDIYINTKDWDLSKYKLSQEAVVGSSGAASTLIPGMYLLTISGDIVLLMNRMSTSSYGVGAIIGYQELKKNILEEEDFPIILARWCGMTEVTDAAILKTIGTASSKIASKALSNFVATSTGIFLARRLGAKLTTRLGTKFTSYLAGKAGASFIPLVGAGVNATANVLLIKSIMKEAEKFYDLKCTALRKI